MRLFLLCCAGLLWCIFAALAREAAAQNYANGAAVFAFLAGAMICPLCKAFMEGE